MLVKNRMSTPVITIPHDTPIMDALDLMKQRNIRRLPIVKKGKMVGIVSDKDLLNAAPSDATTLSVWELNYMIAKITVEDVMSKPVISIDSDTPIENAAYIMAKEKIGGLPVVDDGHLVGLITETDLFKIFIEMMDPQQAGVRVTALAPDKRGQMDVLTHAISEAGGEFVSLEVFAGDTAEDRIFTFKVQKLSQDEVIEKITPFVKEIRDIRTIE